MAVQYVITPFLSLLLCRDVESEELKKQIEIMNCAIQSEQEKASELELMARLFSFGKFMNEDQVRPPSSD